MIGVAFKDWRRAFLIVMLSSALSLILSSPVLATTYDEVLNYYNSLEEPTGCKKRMEQEVQGETTTYKIWLRCPPANALSEQTVTAVSCRPFVTNINDGTNSVLQCGVTWVWRYVGWGANVYFCGQNHIQNFDCFGTLVGDSTSGNGGVYVESDNCTYITHTWNCNQYDTLKATFVLCTEGATHACYDGPAGTAGIGICREGTKSCVNGEWQTTCQNQILPEAEICDGKDNNCNGQTDEGQGECCGNPDPCCGNPNPCCRSSNPCCGREGDPCCRNACCDNQCCANGSGTGNSTGMGNDSYAGD